jgi:hypothetical protein
MQVDPIDDCTFWYTTEYLKANGNWNWNTRIATFNYASCNNFRAIITTPLYINLFPIFPGDPPLDTILTISNTGTAAILISSISLQDGITGPFTISGQTCGSTLAIGAACTVTVRFTPSRAVTGSNTNMLQVFDGNPGSPQQVPLKGTITCTGTSCP